MQFSNKENAPSGNKDSPLDESPSYVAEVKTRYNTADLYTRLEEEASKIMVTVNVDGQELEQTLWEDPLFRDSLSKAIIIHGDELRMDGLYNDHIIRVLLFAMVDFGFTDRERLIALALHDTVENDPKEVVRQFIGEEVDTDDPHEIQAKAFDAIGTRRSRKIVRYLKNLTNPILQKGANKIEEYKKHNHDVYQETPEDAPNKGPDFTDNAVHNHLTEVKAKRLKGDLRYHDLFDYHIEAATHPDSPIPLANQDHVIELYEWGKKQNAKRLEEDYDPKDVLRESLRLRGEVAIKQTGIKVIAAGRGLRNFRNRSKDTDS